MSIEQPTSSEYLRKILLTPVYDVARVTPLEYMEKLSERINTHMLDGLMTGNNDKVEYYNELSGDKNTQKQICNRIIRKIKDWLNLAS